MIKKALYILTLACLGSVLIHIIALFFIPIFSHNKVWQQIKGLSAAYHFTLLPQAHPFLEKTDPSFSVAVCSFNLSDGPVYFSAKSDTKFWSFSLFDQNGENIYSLNKDTSPEQKLELVLADPIETTQIHPQKNLVIVTKSVQKGFALLRSLHVTPLEEDLSKEFLHHAKCQPFD